ncbi:MAG: sugar ABC transporter ATP-binding protein [Christensenella sp.]|nr:sugar ABC transporter ATP-binding protein [Christensenella sp.]
MAKKVFLRVEELTKIFVGVTAVEKANINFYSGEVRGLIGENGSGKSTITSMIAGINKPDGGKIYLDQSEYLPHDQLDANGHGIAILLQEMNTIEGLSIAENIFIGREKMFMRGGIINKKKMNSQTNALLKQYEMQGVDAADDISTLSFEDRKIVEIIKAMTIDPQLLIVDETTTALSQKGRDVLYQLMDRMRKRGKTVIFISHDLQEVLEKCDTITVLRDGKVVGEVENDGTVTENQLKLMMVGRELEHKYYREDYDNKDFSEVVLSVNGICLEKNSKEITFDLHKGEILGIGGLTASGMHELGKVLYGTYHPVSGNVECKGKKITGIDAALKSGVAYISKNRDKESLMLLAGIKDNICLPSLDKLKKHGRIAKKDEEEFATLGAQTLDVKMAGLDQYVLFLSGGNKQKVALATWVNYGPDVMILDCPTRGIDVKVKAAIYRLMEKLTGNGISIIMISEELPELLGMSDRILIMNEKGISKEFKRSRDLSEETVIEYII